MNRISPMRLQARTTLLGLLVMTTCLMLACKDRISEADANYIRRFESPDKKLEIAISGHGGRGLGAHRSSVISLCEKGKKIEQSLDQFSSDGVIVDCEWLGDDKVQLTYRREPSRYQEKIGKIGIEWQKLQ